MNGIWRTQCPLKCRCILKWGSKVELQLQGCTASSSICHHGKSDIWVQAAKGFLQLKPRSPRCNNVIKKDCWESFCFLTTQRFTDTKPWLMLGFARKECSWESRNFKLQLFHEYVFDSGGSEIVLEDPFLNMKRKALKYVSCLLCPPHRRILMTYPREVLVLWPIQIFYERHRQNLWKKFSKNERCTNFA